MIEGSADHPFKHAGARALVILHDSHLREFLEVWKQFVASGAQLPKVEDPDYASPEVLLQHVLGCARHYLEWICTQLRWPHPGTMPTPAPDELADGATHYLDHILECWRLALTELTQRVCDLSSFDSAWGPPYCVDAMLEHAVMHPIRHTFQLRELLQN